MHWIGAFIATYFLGLAGNYAMKYCAQRLMWYMYWIGSTISGAECSCSWWGAQWRHPRRNTTIGISGRCRASSCSQNHRLCSPTIEGCHKLNWCTFYCAQISWSLQPEWQPGTTLCITQRTHTGSTKKLARIVDAHTLQLYLHWTQVR